MFRILPLVLSAALVVGCNREGPHHTDHQKSPGHDHAHHAKATLMVQTEPAAVEAGKPATLKLMIHDANGAMVKNFDVVHDAKVHLIIVRAGLDHFDHIHPDVDAAGNLTVTFTFPTGGTYRVFADHQPAGGKQGTATAEVKVGGASPVAATLTPDVPGKVKGDGLEAEVSVTNAKAGGEGTIQFTLTDMGKPVKDLLPYMGAMGHLVVVSQDGKEYVHAHPADEKPAKGSNVVVFQAHFMKAGLYKGWGQFRWQDRVRVVPFVLKVE